MKKHRVNIKQPFIATETRKLPIECKNTVQIFWHMRGIQPVNIIMMLKEINKKEGTVTFECKIPYAISHYMMPKEEEK